MVSKWISQKRKIPETLKTDGANIYIMSYFVNKKIRRFKVYNLYSLFIFQSVVLEGFIHFIRYTVI